MIFRATDPHTQNRTPFLTPVPVTSEENMRRPEVEPGSTAWRAAMLTVIPQTLLPHTQRIFSGVRSRTWTPPVPKPIPYNLETVVRVLNLNKIKHIL
ncbi:hypothetical protein AVEN_135970-1 [Araneus ventricosus]|uniref:Uncharacterized protein n=1 Tax=Araneus ventricosus TaxID=182803 RepID=A0A4Y2JUB8_ARAVE|nr:hypothetical protein AVEN_135970-1 [Araneus ventricosus]